MTVRIFRSYAVLTVLGAALAIAAMAPSDASAQRARRGVAAQTASAPATGAAEGSGEGIVNIQTATPEQLQLLPGIGPAKAQAIVELRERRAFRRVEDLMRVRGIGRATFRRLRPLITVEGATTLRTEFRAPRATPEPDAEEADVAEE